MCIRDRKQVLDSDTTFVKMFPYEIKDYSSYKLLSSRDFSYEQFLGFTSPDGAVRFMQPDGIADLLSPEEVVEYNAALEELLSDLFFEENDDLYYKNLELEDLKQWLIKGIWYFDKKYSELIYRPIAISPVRKAENIVDSIDQVRMFYPKKKICKLNLLNNCKRFFQIAYT